MATTMDTTIGMSGDYNANSLSQMMLIDSAIPYIRNGINALEISPAAMPLIIADFGSAHGLNSLHAMKTIIKFLEETKKIDNSRQVLVVHNDLPRNDWTCLFELLNKDNSYHGVASGRSFYEACCPSNGLSIGFSSSSLHWLSCKPCDLSNHCVVLFAEDNEREAFKHQAKLDFTSFIEHRSRELIPGGVLILNIPGVNNQGLTGYDMYLDWLYNCAQSCSLLSSQELHAYSIPFYFRSLDECVDIELFDRCSLKLIKVEMNQVKLPLSAQYKDGHLTLDQFANKLMLTVRSDSELSLRQALKLNERSKEDIDRILAQFWATYEEKIKEKSLKNEVYFFNTYLVLKKV